MSEGGDDVFAFATIFPVAKAMVSESFANYNDVGV